MQLDLKRAFDLVSHMKLLGALARLQILVYLYIWVKNFLQSMRILLTVKKTQHMKSLKRGVP